MKRATVLMLGLLLMLAPGTLLAQQVYEFEVDTTRSSVNLEVIASPPGITASDDTESRFTGTILAELTPAPASFSSIHILEMDLALYDSLFLRLDFSAAGRLDITAPPQEVQFSLAQTSEPAEITDTTFTQTQNIFDISGTLDLDASGLISLGVGDSAELDSELEFDIEGSVTESDGMIRLILPLAIVDTTDISGVPLILRLNGVIVAHAESVGTSTEREELPSTVVLAQNYPNPFNPSTSISFTLEQAGHVTLEVYDVLGRLVTTLVDAPLPPGSHEAVFEAGDLPSGTYVYRLSALGSERQRTMVLLR